VERVTRGDAPTETQDPVELAHHGQTRRRVGDLGASHLVEQRPEAAHRQDFKLSNDPQFEEKFWDVIGLYLDPPDKAPVLCCDEKSQCQAPERTQLGLPLAPKRPRTRSSTSR
jgi:hypothetical protein